MSGLIGEGHSTRRRVGGAIALAAAAAIAAGCGSSAPEAAPQPAAHEIVDHQLSVMQRLAAMCLNLKRDKVYERDYLPGHTVEIKYQDGRVTPTDSTNERACVVNRAEIGHHLVPTAVSFARADGEHATLIAGLSPNGQAVTMRSIVVEAATGSRADSIVGVNALTPGPVFPEVVAVGTQDLSHATAVPAGS